MGIQLDSKFTFRISGNYRQPKKSKKSSKRQNIKQFMGIQLDSKFTFRISENYRQSKKPKVN